MFANIIHHFVCPVSAHNTQVVVNSTHDQLDTCVDCQADSFTKKVNSTQESTQHMVNLTHESNTEKSSRLRLKLCSYTLNIDSSMCDLTKANTSRGSLVAKNRWSILVAIFPICLARFNRCSACTVGQWPLPPSWAERSVGPLRFASLAVTHTNPIALSTQCPLIRAAHHRVVGNTVNTRGDRRHVSPVTPTITSCMVTSTTRQGSVPFALFAGGGNACCCCYTHYACGVGNW